MLFGGCKIKMNERIKELAEQAGIHPSNFEPDADIKVPMEKFAELIVKECVSICMKNQFDGAENYNNGSVSSAEFIKEHFGVEE